MAASGAGPGGSSPRGRSFRPRPTRLSRAAFEGSAKGWGRAAGIETVGLGWPNALSEDGRFQGCRGQRSAPARGGIRTGCPLSQSWVAGGLRVFSPRVRSREEGAGGAESPRAEPPSRKVPVASGKEVDWRGFEGSTGPPEESSEIKRPEQCRPGPGLGWRGIWETSPGEAGPERGVGGWLPTEARGQG